MRGKKMIYAEYSQGINRAGSVLGGRTSECGR
jgi:hypothetical protein